MHFLFFLEGVLRVAVGGGVLGVTFYFLRYVLFFSVGVWCCNCRPRRWRWRGGHPAGAAGWSRQRLDSPCCV